MADPLPNPIPEVGLPRTDVEDTLAQRPESTILGDHELLDEIARGGMGIVYRARQRSLDRIVALKLIISGHEASEQELGRFEIEAKAAARLDHPYIVPVYSFGKMNGQPFFTMGFVDGVSLAVRLAREGALPPNDAAELVKLVAYALDYAHSQKVVHRDIKPGNILIDEEGQPRVTDFGLAKRQDAEQGMTATGQVLGTPTYMAPEQAAGEDAGPAADIYSLGATLYATLTGGPPFEATSLPELLLMIADELPVAPRTRNPSVPEPLSQITMRCLAKRPEDRYASAKELAEDLERFQEGHAIHKRVVAPKRSRWILAAALALLPIIGIVAWSLMKKEPISVVSKSSQETTTNETANTKGPRLTLVETQLLADLDAAMDGILPKSTEGPWLLLYEESAKAYQRAFETAGIDVFKLDPEEYAVSLKSRPAGLHEAIINGLELWELMATAAKRPEAQILRSVQSSLDEIDWRRGIRILREDNKAPEILAGIKGLDLTGISEAQLNALGLMVFVHAPNVSNTTLEALTHLQSKAPESYWLNMLQATELFSESSLNANEKSHLLTTAVSPLRTAQSARPKSPSPASLLSRVFRGLGNHILSESEAEYVLSLLNPIALEHLQLARQAKNSGDLETAIHEAELSVEESPTFMPSLVELVKYSIEQKNDLKRNEAFKRLLNLPATETDAMAIALRIFDDLSTDSQGPATQRLIDPMMSMRRARAWQTVVDFRDRVTYKAFEQLSYELYGAGQDPIPASREAVKVNPNGADMLRLHAMNLVQRNVDFQETIETANKAIEVDPINRIEMDLTIAVAMARHGDLTESKRVFHENILRMRKAGVDTRELNATLWYQHLANAHDFQTEASHELVNGPIRQENPWRPLDTISAALLDSYAGDELSLINHVALATHECMKFRSPWISSYCIQAFLRMGQLELAEDLLSHSIYDEATYQRNWLMVSLAALQRGDVELAAFSSKKAHQTLLDGVISDRAAIVSDGMVGGLTRLAANDIEGAIEWLTPLYIAHKTEESVHSWAWSINGGFIGDYIRALIAHGELDLARQILEEQHSMRPEDGNLYWASGLLHLAKKTPNFAIQEFEKAIKLDPLNGLIELDLARTLVDLGKIKSALPHLQKAVTMSSQGRIRGCRPVAIEAASIAVQNSFQKELTPQQSLACRARALQWLQTEFNKQELRFQSDNPLYRSGAKQSIERMLESSAASELQKFLTNSNLQASEIDNWLEFWSKAKSFANNANTKRLLPVEERVNYWIHHREIENRKSAEWVLEKGGEVLITPRSRSWLDIKIRERPALPEDAFSIHSISFHNTPITENDLREIKPIPRLISLFLEGTSVSDGILPMIPKKFPELRLLNLDRTNITGISLSSVKMVDRISLKETNVSLEILDTFIASRPKLDVFKVLHDTGRNSSFDSGSETFTARNFALRLHGLKSIDTKIERNSVLPTTIECFVYSPTTLVTRYSYPLHGYGNSENESVLAMNINRRTVRGESREANKVISNTKAVPILFEVWTHVAIVYDGQEMRSFVDGKLVDSVRFAITPTDLRYRIGGTGNSDVYFFEGDLDEIRISSTARYDADFTPTLRHEQDEYTLALYHFDEGEGEIAHDASGNGHDLQLNGTSWVQRKE